MSNGERDCASVGIVAETDTDESSCKLGYVGPVRHARPPERTNIRLQFGHGRVVRSDALIRSVVPIYRYFADRFDGIRR